MPQNNAGDIPGTKLRIYLGREAGSQIARMITTATPVGGLLGCAPPPPGPAAPPASWKLNYRALLPIQNAFPCNCTDLLFSTGFTCETGSRGGHSRKKNCGRRNPPAIPQRSPLSRRFSPHSTPGVLSGSFVPGDDRAQTVSCEEAIKIHGFPRGDLPVPRSPGR